MRGMDRGGKERGGSDTVSIKHVHIFKCIVCDEMALNELLALS